MGGGEELPKAAESYKKMEEMGRKQGCRELPENGKN